ncbi:Uncharacterised protein [Clostridioides difficile]|nr:Uncharacterised protein [Clostridioides difficile]
MLYNASDNDSRYCLGVEIYASRKLGAIIFDKLVI